MAHLATMMQGFHPFRLNDTVFQKTVGINDFYLHGPNGGYPLGQIQSQGRTHGVMAQTVAPWIPAVGVRRVGGAGRGLAGDVGGPAARREPRHRRPGRPHPTATTGRTTSTPHQQLVRETKRILRRLGFWVVVAHSHRGRNTTHQCGTLVFGNDPRSSVLDTYCRTHDVENLFVVDASFFPSSAAVNPGLTIAAQALRVADHIRDTHLGCD